MNINVTIFLYPEKFNWTTKHNFIKRSWSHLQNQMYLTLDFLLNQKILFVWKITCVISGWFLAKTGSKGFRLRGNFAKGGLWNRDQLCHLPSSKFGGGRDHARCATIALSSSVFDPSMVVLVFKSGKCLKWAWLS